MTLFALGAWQACGMVFFSALQQLSSPQCRGAQLRLPGAGLVPANGVLAAAAGGALCAVWAVWHNAPWSWPLQVGFRRRAGGASQLPCSCVHAMGTVVLPAEGRQRPVCCALCACCVLAGLPQDYGRPRS